MTTLVIADERCLAHDPGPGHPERPERLRALLDELAPPPPGVVRWAARAAVDGELAAVHAPAYLAALRDVDGASARLDPDTATSPGSVTAARLAAGAAIDAATAIWTRAADNAFVLARPPGHHAEAAGAMGFCLLNNAALAAEAARRAGARRVLLLDFDVHHGNGTQHVFAARRDVLYASIHQFPFYPGTGAPTEVGRGEGAGFTVNVALPPGQDDADYGAAFHEVFLPIADEYRPDMVIVSAGFDAHARDPLGGMALSERGFAAMTAALRGVADAHAGGRLLLLLEGGYDLVALRGSVRACLDVLRGGAEEFPRGSRRARAGIAETRAALASCWPRLAS